MVYEAPKAIVVEFDQIDILAISDGKLSSEKEAESKKQDW